MALKINQWRTVCLTFICLWKIKLNMVPSIARIRKRIIFTNLFFLFFFSKFLPFILLLRGFQNRFACFSDRVRTTNNMLGDCYAAAVVEHLSKAELQTSPSHGSIVKNLGEKDVS